MLSNTIMMKKCNKRGVTRAAGLLLVLLVGTQAAHSESPSSHRRLGSVSTGNQGNSTIHRLLKEIARSKNLSTHRRRLGGKTNQEKAVKALLLARKKGDKPQTGVVVEITTDIGNCMQGGNYKKGQIGVIIDRQRSGDKYKVKIVLKPGKKGKSYSYANLRDVPENHFKVIQYSMSDGNSRDDLCRKFNLHNKENHAWFPVDAPASESAFLRGLRTVQAAMETGVGAQLIGNISPESTPQKSDAGVPAPRSAQAPGPSSSLASHGALPEPPVYNGEGPSNTRKSSLPAGFPLVAPVSPTGRVSRGNTSQQSILPSSQTLVLKPGQHLDYYKRPCSCKNPEVCKQVTLAD